MIVGYTSIKGSVRRPRKGATIYRRPEIAVVFGALEANPGSTLFEGTVSDTASPPVWQGGLLMKGTFTANPSKQIALPPMSETQRLGLALLYYTHALADMLQSSPALQHWQQWAQAWLEGRSEGEGADLAAMLDVEWPYPGFKYLVRAAYQMTSETELRDRISTVIGQAMVDVLRSTNQGAVQLSEEDLLAMIQQAWKY